MNVVEEVRRVEDIVESNEIYDNHENFLPLFSSQIEGNSISTSDGNINLNLEDSVSSEDCNDSKIDSEIEEEKIPAWMRYLPKTNFSKNNSKGAICSKTVEKSHRQLIKVRIAICTATYDGMFS